MNILCDYEYLKPQTLEECWILLSEFRGATILAGGTDLVCNIKEGHVAPKTLIDIKAIKELEKIVERDGRVHIGALATFSQIIDSKLIFKHSPLMVEMAKTVASVAIRNRATLVGNICSAVPSLDSGAPLLVAEAIVHVSGLDGERQIPIESWFKGPRKTAIKANEIVTSISLPICNEQTGSCYVKLGRYRGEDLAQAAVAISVDANNFIKVAFAAVGPIPTRATEIEKFISGREIDDILIFSAKEMVPSLISPITDIRATKEYRTHMCKVMFERGLKEAIRRLNGDGTPYGTQII